MKSRHSSGGSESSAEHSQANGSSTTSHHHHHQQPDVPTPPQGSLEHPQYDIWELKSSMGGGGGAEGVVRKSSKISRRSSGKKNSVKISDRISEVPPCYLQDDLSMGDDSINDSINSELSAVAALGVSQDSQEDGQSVCSSTASTSNNYEGIAAQSQSNVNDSSTKWKSIGDPSDSFTCTSTQSCQIVESSSTCRRPSPVSLTEVENDRPLSHFSTRINRGRSASTSSIPTGRVMSTDL